MAGPHVHTEGSSVLDGTDLGWLLDDLTDGSNIHAGIHQMADGSRTVAEDTSLDIPATQLLLTQLCGNADALDAVGAIAGLIEWVTSDANPALANLPLEIRKNVQHQGELAAHALRDPELRDATALACAALNVRKEVHPVTDNERKELSQKVADANKRSSNRPQ
jgi:hypothetical protein